MPMLNDSRQWRNCIPLVVIILLVSPDAHADWRDLFRIFDGKDEVTADSNEQVPGGLSESEIVGGLKEALNQGTQAAVSLLGRKDGFLANPAVRIPMPDSLRKVEKGLRKIGQERVVDNFVETMNRAAEQAVPEAASIFADTVRDMSINDARQILQGADDAATQYFRRHSEASLKEKFRPIVSAATNDTGVTSSYKKLTDKIGVLGKYVDREKLDLDEYITRKAMDGLFIVVAAEEKKIRAYPLQRSTELLKKVFGSSAR